ncbi:hypothetical protein D7Y41_23120 [Anaerotruncus sp. 1XD22-93]|jgi:hypothetical protein|nr:hypothetical protein D7Y41_23120 [Anaerotruncus sp. 1XD22-93]
MGWDSGAGSHPFLFLSVWLESRRKRPVLGGCEESGRGKRRKNQKTLKKMKKGVDKERGT